MQVGENVGLGSDVMIILPGGEVAVAQLFLALSQRAAFGLPFGHSAIEDRDIVGAEHLEHEPGAGRGFDRAVIIEHDPAAIT